MRNNIGAIKAIQMASRIAKHTIVIRFSFKADQWTIRVFGNNFKDNSFNKCAAKACEFILKIKEENK